MRTDTLDKIKTLRTGAKSLRGFWDMWCSKYASDSSCDKKGARFSPYNDRFQGFRLNIGFECYAGYYGNSSSYTVPIVNSELALPYFIKALNEMSGPLFARVAELMEEDAKTMTAAAQAEIDAMQNMLAEIEAVPTADPATDPEYLQLMAGAALA